jgi:hypothetical protein
MYRYWANRETEHEGIQARLREKRRPRANVSTVEKRLSAERVLVGIEHRGKARQPEPAKPPRLKTVAG